jgi:glutathione synthase/RimK-type ligase-like ATP-grasp enzyme
MPVIIPSRPITAGPSSAVPPKKVGTTQLLFNSAQRLGLDPQRLGGSRVFSINTPGGEQYVNLTLSSLNPHISSSLSRNKHVTRLILEKHGLPNIPFARPYTMAEAKVFLQTHKTVIVKPLKGSGSRGIRVVDMISQIADIDVRKYIFEKYIPGIEMRYLILNGAVIAVHESEYGTSVDSHRELRRISYQAKDWNADLESQSLRIASILGLRFAAVDFMVDNSGHAYILEVNTIPGLKWFHAPSSGPPVDVATLFLQAMLTI